MSSKRPIYLDFNATTPVDKRGLAEMLPYFCVEYAIGRIIQASKALQLVPC